MVALKSRRILVVGDLALDRYTHGHVERISPEAPVPILHSARDEERAGMAGNVALGLLALGQQVTLLGRIGNDAEGSGLARLLEKEGVATALHQESGFVTPVKHRFIASNQQLIRVDREVIAPLSQPLEQAIIDRLASLLESIDAIAVSDYGKGFLTPSFLASLISSARARSIPILVDPKGADFSRYSGATVIKPNLREARLAARLEASAPLEEVAATLHSQALIDALLITRAEEGLSLFFQDGKREDIPAVPLEVRDVTGAGDTVLAILTSSLANRLSHIQAAQLSNRAAGLAVQRFGCVPISLADLQHSKN